MRVITKGHGVAEFSNLSPGTVFRRTLGGGLRMKVLVDADHCACIVLDSGRPETISPCTEVVEVDGAFVEGYPKDEHLAPCGSERT